MEEKYDKFMEIKILVLKKIITLMGNKIIDEKVTERGKEITMYNTKECVEE